MTGILLGILIVYYSTNGQLSYLDEISVLGILMRMVPGPVFKKLFRIRIKIRLKLKILFLWTFFKNLLYFLFYC